MGQHRYSTSKALRMWRTFHQLLGMNIIDIGSPEWNLGESRGCHIHSSSQVRRVFVSVILSKLFCASCRGKTEFNSSLVGAFSQSLA